MDGLNGSMIRTSAALEAACVAARADGVLALDTEFVWTHTYRPRLGIVQMGCRSGCWVLDCMSGMHLDILRETIEDGAVIKILHDARQDLTLLRHYANGVPKSVFDTQLAAAFAGFSGGIGLQKLLFEAIGVGLPKTETCTDWTRRPLSPAQLEYALDDVRHLPALRDELLRRAEAFGTVDWLNEDLLRYEDAAAYCDQDPDSAWLRVKLRSVRLEGNEWAVLRAVAALRERQALQWNLPRSWLGDDDSLAEMAQRGKVMHLRHRLKSSSQADILRGLYAKTIDEAKALPEEDWPENPRRTFIKEVRDAADAAVEWLWGRAEELHVDSGVIASRTTVTEFIDNPDDAANPLASGWRSEMVGKEMIARFGVD